MPPIISPYAMRSTVSEEIGALRISIPMRKKPFPFLSLSAWLSVWTVGGTAVVHQLLTKFNLFAALGMCGWFVGETIAIYALLRMAAGVDVVRIQHGVFEVRKQIFGWGVSKRYSLPEVRDLRFQPESDSGRSHRDSKIAFDYGAKTVTLGDGVEEAEANQLIGMIVERYKLPQTTILSDSLTRFWNSG